MKHKIIKIAKDLEQGAITTKTARILLLGLFGVSCSDFDKLDELDVTRCPKCGSTDHTMITSQPYKCMDCGHIWV